VRAGLPPAATRMDAHLPGHCQDAPKAAGCSRLWMEGVQMNVAWRVAPRRATANR
jgi:hypothetical protein